ncbi:hypothetical protein XA68_11969 [Ophiocordyceps unilateralis]|uniref:Uncharacterized protein n=1 Tax=Ophiocordyceps unilateralis TaxID=268505 RepID=A0A2A9PFU7_OPHUN|nr:hypothetical protein XA68_11969 [Ophiocordyceps unilateralis]
MASSQDEGGQQQQQQQQYSIPNPQSNGLSHLAASEVDAGLFQRCLDYVVAPSSRRRAYDYASSVASSRPILFSLVASQLLFSFLPLLLFVAFAAATVAFALGAAVLFALFWVAFALLLLLPALLVASSIALLVWAWALFSFFVARWVWTNANGAAAAKQDHHRHGIKAETKAENGD